MQTNFTIFLLKTRNQYLFQLLVISTILYFCSQGRAYCEGMNFLDHSQGFIFNANENGALTVEYIEAPQERRLPPSIENPAQNKVRFVSIDDYWEMAKKRGGGSAGHLHPFIQELLTKLSLVEKEHGVEVISKVDSSIQTNQVASQCYRFFPIPGSRYVNTFYLNSFVIDNQLKLIYSETRHNPLILYSYATFLHFGELCRSWVGQSVPLLPTVDVLQAYYELSFEKVQKLVYFIFIIHLGFKKK